MKKDIIKEAWKEAENSSREKQKEEVKKIIEKTLLKLKNIENDIDSTNEKIKSLRKQKKILEMDLDDIKNGRLDLMSERQEKDEESRNVSVVVVTKEREIIREKESVTNPWYWPYHVRWQDNTHNPLETVYYNSTHFYSTCQATSDLMNNSVSLTCSSAKDFAAGTYSIQGEVISLR